MMLHAVKEMRSRTRARALSLRLQAQRLQAGAGMVEVMIAIVISAFALLGLAGLQVSALRYQKVANYHATASQYAGELADRIRANINGARSGGYGLAPTEYTPNAPVEPNQGSCKGAQPSACTPAQTAALDIYRWRLNLNRGMAGGWGEVSGDVTSGFTIRVYYKESVVDGASSAAADPACRAGAVPSSEKNVRCFVTVMIP